MHRNFVMTVVLGVAAAVAAHGQAANPLSAELKGSYTAVKTNLLKMADKMPDDAYSYKPVAELQNFGQRIAHIVDANMGTCARIKGEQKTVGAASKSSKADLVAAMKESFAYCDGVIDALTDADAVQPMAGGRGPGRSKLSTLWGAVAHSNEMYGYMSVYMRMKGIVPPSSEGR